MLVGQLRRRLPHIMPLPVYSSQFGVVFYHPFRECEIVVDRKHVSCGLIHLQGVLKDYGLGICNFQPVRKVSECDGVAQAQNKSGVQRKVDLYACLEEAQAPVG